MKRINSLTGWKAIAMCIIFMWHSGIPNPSADVGARSCELLFVISGFLVGYNHFCKPLNPTWKTSVEYTAGKIAKFWPLHAILLVIMVLRGRLRHEIGLKTFSTLMTAGMHLTMTQAWSSSSKVYFAFNGASWFLSALAFCYFLSPFMMKFLKRKRVTAVLFFTL